MKKSFKTAFLYIGTAIGAGFSSGKEIALFFGDVSPLNVAISSVFMSLLCGLFLIAGKLDLMPKNKLMGFAIFLSAGISLCSMCAGGEFVMRSMTGVPLLGLAMAILGGIIVVLGIEKIKVVNSLIVPLIVLCVALIFFKLDAQVYTLPFSLTKPILYSGLDVLLGGVIISEEGKKLSYKEIVLSCALICVCLFGLLFMLQTVVLADDLHSSMPVLAVSQKFNLKAVCGVLIAGAIFTTLVSSLKIASDKIADAMLAKKLTLGGQSNRSLIIFGCLLIAFPISFVGFDNIVDTMYPFISWCGIVLTAIVVVRLVIKIFRRILRAAVIRKNKKAAALTGDGAKLSPHRNAESDSRDCANDSDTHHRNRRRSNRRDSDSHLHRDDSRNRRRDSDTRLRRSPRRPRPATYPQREICGRPVRPSP